MGVILLGDKTAAAHWLSYAKSRAAALAKQGNNLSQTFSPADGVNIRVQTLQGTPRVWIEAGGADYVCSFGLNQDGTSQTLWTGRMRAGAARPAGKSLYGGSSKKISNLMPLGGGEFLGGPALSGEHAGYVQYIKTPNGRPSGTAFAPWQPGFPTGIKAICYSGLRQDLDDTIQRRFHLAYYYFAPPQGHPDRPAIRMPAVATTYDGGQTPFSVDQFYVPITVFYSTGFGGTVQAEVDPIGMVFFGNNTVAVVSYTYSSGYYLESGAGVSDDIAYPLYGVHTLLSTDGGGSWSSHHTTYDSLGMITYDDPFPGYRVPLINYFGAVCYIGGSSVIATTTYYGSGSVRMLVMRSDDFGQTFYLVSADNGHTPPGYGGISAICDGCAGYAAINYREFVPGVGFIRYFYRTVDGGYTWSRHELPPEINAVYIGTVVLRETIAAPAVMPLGKTAVDYAKLAVVYQRKSLPEDPTTPYKIALSDDGGATWRIGGTISADNAGYNIGVMDRKLLPFPGFPDLHKNGLTIP